MITIKDIAKEAKVSAGTVDRVLHDRGGVSPETEAKIKKILKKKKFKINLIASSLAMKKHQKLATLMPRYDAQNLFWRSPYSGVKKASQEVIANGIENNIFLLSNSIQESIFISFILSYLHKIDIYLLKYQYQVNYESTTPKKRNDHTSGASKYYLQS